MELLTTGSVDHLQLKYNLYISVSSQYKKTTGWSDAQIYSALQFDEAAWRLCVLTVKTSSHTFLSMFHDTVAVIMSAQVICLQFNLLKRESKGVRRLL